MGRASAGRLACYPRTQGDSLGRTRQAGAVVGCALLLSAGSRPAKASLDPDKPLTQYIHQAWQAAEGLPQNSVLALAQTADGYLWLGTEEGLVRFDGARFVVFDKRTAGLNDNQIQSLFVDSHQNLWIGSISPPLARSSSRPEHRSRP